MRNETVLLLDDLNTIKIEYFSQLILTQFFLYLNIFFFHEMTGQGVSNIL